MIADISLVIIPFAWVLPADSMNDDVTRVLLLPVQVQHVQLLREHAAHRRRRQERRGGLL